MFNAIVLACIVGLKIRKPSQTVSEPIFIILSSNLTIYLLFFAVSKRISLPDEGNNVCLKYCPGLTGIIFTVIALALGFIAAYFYTNGNVNRYAFPAESRNLNEDCFVADFYDYHDMWHFCSAAAIFMAFIALLIVDDNLINTPQDQIPVF